MTDRSTRSREATRAGVLRVAGDAFAGLRAAGAAVVARFLPRADRRGGRGATSRVARPRAGPPGEARLACLARRAMLAAVLAMQGPMPAQAQVKVPSQAQVTAARAWPGPDSTRFTLESSQALTYRMFTLRDPDRVVLELDLPQVGPALAALPASVPADDPRIRQVRVGLFKPGVIRVVVELRGEALAETFALTPVGERGHRIVLDVFAADARDPVAAFLKRQTIASGSGPAAGAARPEGGAPPVSTPPAPGVAPAAPVDAATPGIARSPTPAAATPAAGPGAGSPPGPARGAGDPAPAGRAPGASAPAGAEAAAGPGVEPAASAGVPGLPGGRALVIAIDPGHGGEDPGAIGPGGVREKDVVLAIGRRLARLVDATPGLRAVLTRDGDYFVPLQGRVSRARAVKADLFVSIHADAWFQPTARGSSVYALSLSGATSAAARWLARRENESDRVGGINLNVADPVLKHTLLDLTMNATISDSLRLGRHVLAELGGINRLHRRQVEQAGFAVLKAPDIPSILVETAFISNPEEEARLSDPEHQERLAQAILSGIRRYLLQTPSHSRAR
jgi:N-acetylmuramoyl-L-alanine amidase